MLSDPLLDFLASVILFIGLDGLKVLDSMAKV